MLYTLSTNHYWFQNLNCWINCHPQGHFVTECHKVIICHKVIDNLHSVTCINDGWSDMIFFLTCMQYFKFWCKNNDLCIFPGGIFHCRFMIITRLTRIIFYEYEHVYIIFVYMLMNIFMQRAVQEVFQIFNHFHFILHVSKLEYFIMNRVFCYECHSISV